MIAYILSNEDLSIRDILEYDVYSFCEDIFYADKSSIKTIKKPNIYDNDFIICKEDNEIAFVGVCESVSAESEGAYSINMMQKECFFDREILIGDEGIMQETGIEDFIKSEIEDNWIDTGDTLLDKDYIEVNALTHTPVHATIDGKGTYNLKEFLGSAKEYYRLFVDFYFNNQQLVINLRVDNSLAEPIDVTVTDVIDYSEIYSVDVLAKLIVNWRNTDTEEESIHKFYLKNDMTITTDASDPSRVIGIVKSLYVEKRSNDEMYQAVVDSFKSNSYEHKISFMLSKDSQIYPVGKYYVGRPALIKTRSGTKESLITGISRNSDSSFYNFVFGNLKVTLIEKIRSLR